MTKPKNKDCQRCGWCCRSMILEATNADAEREPKIAARGLKMRCGSGYILNGPVSKKYHCIFLDGNDCKIYDTRPDVCRWFGPHDFRCRQNQKEKR